MMMMMMMMRQEGISRKPHKTFSRLHITIADAIVFEQTSQNLFPFAYYYC